MAQLIPAIIVSAALLGSSLIIGEYISRKPTAFEQCYSRAMSATKVLGMDNGESPIIAMSGMCASGNH